MKFYLRWIFSHFSPGTNVIYSMKSFLDYCKFEIEFAVLVSRNSPLTVLMREIQFHYSGL